MMKPARLLRDLMETIAHHESLFERLEPQVRAFLPEDGRFERLRREARELEERYPDAEGRPALYGTLAGVKDIFHVAGFPTHAGSRLPAEELEEQEAESVSRLKSAGALILGKSVTTEFAYFAPGPTRNPHDLEHTPGGSSSGSAAGVAAGLCSLALGTQTIGSILRPAAYCGVVGLKPSYERISREGVIPLAPSLDHIGLFAASVAQVKIAASALYQQWSPVDPATPMPLGRPALGVPQGPYLDNASVEGMAHFYTVCERLQAHGYHIRHIPSMPDFPEIRDRHQLILAAEAAQVHAAWYEKFAQLYAPQTADLIERGRLVAASELAQALAGRARLRYELTALMDAHEVDLWISPSAPGPAPLGLDSTGNPVMNLPWTHAGLPCINLPSGKNHAGLPFGLQVTARWQADELLLSWAEELERALSYP